MLVDGVGSTEQRAFLANSWTYNLYWTGNVSCRFFGSAVLHWGEFGGPTSTVKGLNRTIRLIGGADAAMGTKN